MNYAIRFSGPVKGVCVSVWTKYAGGEASHSSCRARRQVVRARPVAKPAATDRDSSAVGANVFGVRDLAPGDLISRGVLDSNWGPLRLQQYQRYVF